MDETFRIYVDRLRDGQVEEIEESLDPAFLEIADGELSFKVPVKLKGKAFLSEETFIFHFDAETEASMPCAICNEEAKVTVKIPNYTHDAELREVKSGIFDFRELLREVILLGLPSVAECHEGACPERKNLSNFFSKEKKDEGTYNPFADL